MPDEWRDWDYERLPGGVTRATINHRKVWFVGEEGRMLIGNQMLERELLSRRIHTTDSLVLNANDVKIFLQVVEPGTIENATYKLFYVEKRQEIEKL